MSQGLVVAAIDGRADRFFFNGDRCKVGGPFGARPVERASEGLCCLRRLAATKYHSRALIGATGTDA